jgi:hypothetical protein
MASNNSVRLMKEAWVAEWVTASKPNFPAGVAVVTNGYRKPSHIPAVHSVAVMAHGKASLEFERALLSILRMPGSGLKGS